MKNIQINISIPFEWKKQLERHARIISVKEDKNFTYIDLIRIAIRKIYELDNNETK